MKRHIVIYHEDLLAYSETFILNQAESLRHFTPHYLGTRRTQGLLTPPERTTVLNGGTALGRAEELLYKASGYSPRLNAQLRFLQPLLIHAHFGSNGAMVLPLARRVGLPLIVTFHGRDATMHDEALLASGSLRDRRLVTRRAQLARSGALFIAVSEHIRRQLLARGYPGHKIVTHYNGIATTFFTPAPQQQRAPVSSVRSVLFVGRFVEKKGVIYLLRAMAAVQRLMPGVRLVLIGSGPLRPQLEALAHDLNVNCEFLGSQPPEVVLEQMRAAQVFCLPSVTASDGDTEGLPTVLLEALATGLPVVTTLSAGNPEAVSDGETGLLVPERDEAALAQAITRLLCDEPLRRRLGYAARHAVVSGFDAAQQALGLEALYARVAGYALDGGPDSETGRSVRPLGDPAPQKRGLT